MMSQKVPSYVFSKALAQSGEEKQRRQSLPPNWGSEGGPRIKVPPPVALKPKSHVPFSIPEDALKDEVNSGETARRSSLPFVNGRTRTSSSSSDKSDDMDVFGSGQKMGGAFARLQRQIEAKETQRDLYSEAYQSYKAQRSLTAHGVLPKDMREDERMNKYGLDSNNVPPVLLPKPISRLPSASDRRQEFGKARAMTSPVSATPPVLPIRQYRAMEESAGNIASEADVTEYRPDYSKQDAVGDAQYIQKPVPGLPDAPPVIADPAAVECMQKEYRERQEILAQGREELDKTISQLENADELLLHAEYIEHSCGA